MSLCSHNGQGLEGKLDYACGHWKHKEALKLLLLCFTCLILCLYAINNTLNNFIKQITL